MVEGLTPFGQRIEYSLAFSASRLSFRHPYYIATYDVVLAHPGIQVQFTHGSQQKVDFMGGERGHCYSDPPKYILTFSV